MTALGDVYDVEETANALSGSSSEFQTAITGAARAVSELQRSLVGEAGNSVQGIWSAANDPAGTLATVMHSGSLAISDYATALAGAQSDAAQAAQLIEGNGLRLVSGTVMPPDQTHLPDMDRTPGLQKYADQANTLMAAADNGLTAAGQALVNALNGLRDELGDHRHDTYPGPGGGDGSDNSLIVTSVVAGLVAAPADALKEMADDAADVKSKASQFGRDLRSSDPAVASNAGTLLKSTANEAKSLSQEADAAADGWAGKVPGSTLLRTTLGDVGVLDKIPFADRIPVVGAVLTGIGVVVDHHDGKSWGEAGFEQGAGFAGGLAGYAAGAAAGGAAVTAIGATGLVAVGAPIIAGVVVGGLVAYGVGKGAQEIWKHRKGIEHAASSAWNDATGWL